MSAEKAGLQGLRARKKAATREALSGAAIRLALERGFANVRVADVAEAAGVSSRTYNNYFSSREEAICALRAERTENIWNALRSRSAEQPIGEAITEVMVQEYATIDQDKEVIQLIVSEPALYGEFLKNFAAIEARLAAAIAERTGRDVERDLFPCVLAAAVTGATRAAILHWLIAEDGQPLATVLRSALTQVTLMARGLEDGGA